MSAISFRGTQAILPSYVKYVLFSSVALYSAYHFEDVTWYGQVSWRSLRAAATLCHMICDYKLNYSDKRNMSSFQNASHQDGGGECLALAHDWEQQQSVIHARNASRLFAMVQQLGGIYIKLGQHIASLDYILPLEYTSKFRVLQDAAPQSSFADVQGVLLDAYRDKHIGSLYDVFSEFERLPIGTASLAQVHIARLRESGQRVAVKVQHAHLSRTAAMDLWLVKEAVKMAKYIIPDFSLEWLSDEMQRNLPLEMDFQHEGHNADKLRLFVAEDSSSTFGQWTRLAFI
jgi:predicted unusual protein kinase regulating ubiquinone biosynthesis (AarF/ABC1/UbiB family)